MTPEQLAVRKRLFDDFNYYAQHALKVRTKPNEKGESLVAPFVLNRGQRRILERVDAQMTTRGFVRIIIVKGRQMGSSTFVEGWIYHRVSQRKAQRALVVAHDAPATKTVFEMTKRFHENCPEILRPETRYTNVKELSFNILDSSYRIATAGGDGIVRGEMINVAHLSEFAWWPVNSARNNYNGLMDAIPQAPGTAVFIESTANSYNLFWEQCEAARKGESLFEMVFLPWYWDDGYQMPVPEGFEQSPDEEELMALYAHDGLTEGHLVFRRNKIAEKGSDLFKQEYPCSAEEAFLTSGRPVFNPERIAEMLKGKQEPIARKTLNGVIVDKKRKLVWEDDQRGELLCYLPHSDTETYYIGADVGAGVKKDFSVAQVFDSQRRQAAVWRGQADPDYYGTVLAALGRFYNDALICCERNNHGILTNRVIHKDEAYPWVYQETVYDKVTDTETLHVGFFTSERSKPLVIDKLRANVRQHEIEIYDETTLHEMRSFIVTETGRMEAEKGTHDDCVIALALADHINEGAFVPIVNSDEWYGAIE